MQVHEVLLKDNTPLLLDDPRSAWLVHEGSIAVFVMSLEQGRPTGVRRYLFSVEAGEWLFGFDLAGQTCCLVGVAVRSARLEAQPLGQRPLHHYPRWAMQLSSCLAGADEGHSAEQLPATARFSLEPGRWVRGRAHAWLRVLEGELQLGGLAELTVMGGSLLPFPADIRLYSVTACTCSVIDGPDLDDLRQLSTSLALLHTLVLAGCARLQRQSELQERARLLQQEERSRRVAEDALGRLASVLRSDEGPAVVRDDPLLAAVQAIGRSVGFQAKPAARSENLERLRNPLDAIARASKVRLRRVILDATAFERDCGPLLAFAGSERRPVALLPAADSRYKLYDPSQGSTARLSPALAQQLAPEAYMFYRSFPDGPVGVLGIIVFAFSGRVREFLWLLVAGGMASLLGMLVPVFVGLLVDFVVPEQNRGLLVQMGIGLAASAIAIAFFQLLQGLILLRLESLTDLSTQAAIWDRVLNLKLNFFKQYASGDLNSRIMSVIEMRRLLSGATLRAIFNGLFSALNLLLLFKYNQSAAWLVVAISVFVVLVTLLHGWMKFGVASELQRLRGFIFGLVVQLINGMAKLRVMGAESRAFAHWASRYTLQQKLALKIQAVEDSLTGFNEAVPILGLLLLFWFVGTVGGADPGALSNGKFLGFSAAFDSFILGIAALSNALVDSLEIANLWQRVQPVLAAEPEVTTGAEDPGRLTGRIDIANVTFRYVQNAPPILKNISIRIEPGEFVAIVGGSGSGKSTLLRLLLGFEQPESGTIFYDNQDLARLDIRAVRRQLGVVLQNGRVQAGSIFSNISRGALITIEEAWQAAQAAGLAEDIEAMPMGMHTVISEGGGNLSGGQRQRLLIAQAIALRPRILLLDEATSALDNRTQTIVSEALDRLKVTRIVIAHRLSTIRHADRIYVLERGTLVQQGTFDELMRSEGLFARLALHQKL